MTPIRNIHKMLVAVLFTAGAGLLLMGAPAGQTSFTGAGKPVQVSVLAPEAAAQVTVQDIVHPTFGLSRVPQAFHAAPVSGEHKNPKHFRNRLGSDLFYTSFRFHYDHPLFIGLPCEYRGRVFSQVLVTPSLRGPPVA
jgi:hypothetical protein